MAARAAAPWRASSRKNSEFQLSEFSIRASHSVDGNKSRVYKQLGLFSLKKKIEDVILRAEISAPTALELEEARRVKQEEMIRSQNLWNDPALSDEILADFADSAKVVDALKDLKYKAEEAKLITQLAEIDVINHTLFKQAYNASLDVSNFLDQYEMSKLLRGPYDMEGACMIIKPRSKGNHHEVWAEQILSMYIKWAKKHGYPGRLVEKGHALSSGIKSATIEFEFEYAYGYLSGERGSHQMIRMRHDGSAYPEVSSVSVDIVPLFLGAAPNLLIRDEELIISPPTLPEGRQGLNGRPVSIQHIPTGITVQSSGERSYFANKIKALNRLKAKLMITAKEQGVVDARGIRDDAVADVLQCETRRYTFRPQKLVRDVKTGIQTTYFDSVLDGNIEPFIGAHVNLRHSTYSF